VALPNEASTLSLGAGIARGLSGGMVVTLSGELGTGKTTVVRGVLRALGWRGAVKSPSYTLVEHYIFTSLYFYHFDFFRLSDEREWDNLGFGDDFRPDSVCVIEWPERVSQRLRRVDLTLTLTVAGEGRSARIAARSAQGSACLEGLASG
jgi:tRNA threonylcarbamoyladenosine biosynthesis protein TsaE